MVRRVADNPYAAVDWDNVGRYSFQSHAHSDYGSDERHNGSLPPHAVVDFYTEEAPVPMDIIALTDHQRAAETTVFPWTEWSSLDRVPEGVTYEDRDPADLGVVALEGMEVEGPDNEFDQVGGFNAGDLATAYDSQRDIFETIDTRGGVGWFFHPGKYYDDPEKDFEDLYYREYLEEIDACIGLEVINRNNRHPTDEAFWDVALSHLAPETRVVGVAADDLHALDNPERQYPISWMEVLLPPDQFDPTDQAHSRAAIQEAVTQGRTLFMTVEATTEKARPPRIESVNVAAETGEITVDASGADRVAWISEGEIVGEGERLPLDRDGVGTYVRARAHSGDVDTTWTQAIMLETP